MREIYEADTMSRGELVNLAEKTGVLGSKYDYAVPVDWQKNLSRLDKLRFEIHGAIWSYNTTTFGIPLFLDTLYEFCLESGKVHEVKVYIGTNMWPTHYVVIAENRPAAIAKMIEFTGHNDDVRIQE